MKKKKQTNCFSNWCGVPRQVRDTETYYEGNFAWHDDDDINHCSVHDQTLVPTLLCVAWLPPAHQEPTLFVMEL